MELKELIIFLSSLMSVSGSEYRAKDRLCELIGEHFDEISTDCVGNIRLIKRCLKNNPSLVMVDTHFDEIGMVVTKIHEGSRCGRHPYRSRTRTLQASDVIIYGKKTIRGVISSTPPHLRKKSDSDKLTELHDILIDTGYEKEALEELVDIGTPVGFAPIYSELLGNTLVGKSFDNKACAACAIYGVANTPREALAADVCVLLSVHEETVNIGGVAVGGFELEPDYAMVIDVNLAKVPDAPRRESVDFGGGVSISISPITDRKLTKMTEELCRSNDIKFTRVAAPSSTGTNTPALNLVGRGIPTADIGLPLKSMHTPSEVISLDDAAELAKLVSAFISSSEIKEAFSV